MRLLPFAFLLILPATTFACLNDNSTTAAEREFRSRYADPPPATLPSQDDFTLSSTMQINREGVGLLLLGAALLSCAARITRFRRARP